MDNLNLRQTTGVQVERANKPPARAIVDLKVNGIPASILAVEGQPFELRVKGIDVEITFEKMSD